MGRRPSAPARGLPGRPFAALRHPVHRGRPRRLPGAAGVEPEPVHVPAPIPRPRRRRLQPGGPDQGDRSARDHPPDRGESPARKTGTTSVSPRTFWPTPGAGRAPHARRPLPQRPPAGLRPRHGRGRRLHVGAALQPCHAPGVDRRRPPQRACHGIRRARRDLPRGHPVRCTQTARHGPDRRARGPPPRVYGVWWPISTSAGPRYGDRDPDGGRQGRGRLCSGRRGDRRRLGAAPGVRGDREQGGGGAARVAAANGMRTVAGPR